MSADYKYVIIGQGLAGSCLAMEYERLGLSYLVIDHYLPFTSSRVAAGMVNPVTFKRVLRAWNIDTFLPLAKATYSRVEEKFGEQVISPIGIYKVFALEDEEETWKERIADGMAPYLDVSPSKTPDKDQVHQPLGGGMVNQGFWLDVPKFLQLTRNDLNARGRLLEEMIDMEDVQLGRNIVIRLGEKKITAENIVFCEGARAHSNPIFGWLPFRPAKGDVLTIKAPDLDVDYVINRGMFVLPIGDGLFKVGSTFNWEDLSAEPTEAGRNELVEKMKRVIRVPYEIVEHVAGVRPTIADRRPFLGKHPQLGNVWILNGLGSRGVAQAPFFANHLVEYQENGKELMPEVNISRYEKRYRKSLLTHDYFL